MSREMNFRGVKGRDILRIKPVGYRGDESMKVKKTFLHSGGKNARVEGHKQRSNRGGTTIQSLNKVTGKKGGGMYLLMDQLHNFV